MVGVPPAVSALSVDDSQMERQPLNQEHHGNLPPISSNKVSYRPLAPAYHNLSVPPESKSVEKRSLRRRWTWAFLFLIYIPILIVPWVLTCILNSRPLLLANYTDPNPQASFDHNQSVLIIIRMLNITAALMTIPVLSSLLAYGAVAYAKRRSEAHKLSLQQTFALADRAWGNILTPLKFPRSRSLYLYLGSTLIFIGTTLLQSPRYFAYGDQGRFTHLLESSLCLRRLFMFKSRSVHEPSLTDHAGSRVYRLLEYW